MDMMTTTSASVETSLSTRREAVCVTPRAQSPESIETPASADATTNDQQDNDLVPNEMDIVCGRDKRAQHHAGNKRFRKVIQSYRDRYRAATRRTEKTAVTVEIIQLMRRQGARFLKFDESHGIWMNVSEADIHEKVAHALRSCKDPRVMKERAKHASAVQPPTREEDAAFSGVLKMQEDLFVRLMATECQSAQPYYM